MSSDQPAGPLASGGPALSGAPRPVVCASVLVLFGLLVFGLSEEWSPLPALAASPVAVAPGVCVIPGSSGTPAAAMPNATPGIPTAAEGEVPAQITAAVANLAACWQDTNWETGFALVTARFLYASLGTADRALALATLQSLTAAGLVGSVTLDTVADIRTQGVGFASAEVVWRQGKALRHDRWRFIAAEGRWLLDEIAYLDPESTGSAVGIEAVVDGDRLKLSRERIVDPGVIVIHVRNLGTEATTLSVFRSTTTAQLRDRLAGVLPSSGESPFVGEVVVPAREEADLVLIDLAPDTYTIVAGPHQPGGTPQIQDAFSATFAVAEA